jgi:type II secretory pathway component PulF
MPSFQYVATNAEKKTVNGSVDAADRSAALSALTRQGLTPVSLHCYHAVNNRLVLYLLARGATCDVFLYRSGNPEHFIDTDTSFIASMATLVASFRVGSP